MVDAAFRRTRTRLPIRAIGTKTHPRVRERTRELVVVQEAFFLDEVARQVGVIGIQPTIEHGNNHACTGNSQ